MPLDARLPHTAPFLHAAGDSRTDSWTDTPAAAGMATLSGSAIALEAVPDEPLHRVLAFLDDNAVLAFRHTCRRWASASAPFAQALLVKASIRWIVTASDAEQAAARINACRKPLRTDPVQVLLRQMSTLHPDLEPQARRAIQPLLPTPCAKTLLRDRLDRLPLSDCRQHIAPLPEPDRSRLLAAQAARARDDDDGWAGFLRAACDDAQAALAGEHGQSTAALLLPAIAQALHQPSTRDEDLAPARVQLWDRLLDLSQHLTVERRCPVLRQLAPWLSLAAYAGAEAAELEARCARLVEAAFLLPLPADTAAVLSAIVADPYRDEQDHRIERLPLVVRAMQAAARLPEALYAGVLSEVLSATPSYWDADCYALIWNGVAVAADRLTTDATRSPLLAALALHVPWTTPADGDDDADAEERWLAILHRVQDLAPCWRGLPLVALSCSMACAPPGLRPGERLLQLAIPVPGNERAELLDRLIHHPNYCRNRDLWRDMMILYAALSDGDKTIVARALIRALAYFVQRHGTPRDASATLPPSAHGPSWAQWPADRQDAHRKLSALLRQLPEMTRLRLLVQFADTLDEQKWFAPALQWLLEEARSLPPSGRHEALIVTRACAFAAQECPPEDADSALAMLAGEIASLPPARRGGALLYWSDLAARTNRRSAHDATYRCLLEPVPRADRGGPPPAANRPHQP
ncbi:F-box protein [Cupriavidus sp. AU9028]|uniref:F-box protein n=1 Tax=Cupriavidus sp. AU9028 TaxID=2871157 RepID=UPI001C951169|nr:F-box protein [Cupriavidus sp. AU9028]MBY4898439.1 F-box protein [Cupriavidus sp. AU9028]